MNQWVRCAEGGLHSLPYLFKLRMTNGVKKIVERVRTTRVSKANHELSLWLDEPGLTRKVAYGWPRQWRSIDSETRLTAAGKDGIRKYLFVLVCELNLQINRLARDGQRED
jgi:hypothetical protein